MRGVTGEKKGYTSLPYGLIQASSVETAGTFDLDSELDMWFSGSGRSASSSTVASASEASGGSWPTLRTDGF